MMLVENLLITKIKIPPRVPILFVSFIKEKALKFYAQDREIAFSIRMLLPISLFFCLSLSIK